jgi:hypothetical protein
VAAVKVPTSVYVIWYAAAVAALAGLLFFFPYPWLALVALWFAASGGALLKALASGRGPSVVAVREYFRVSSYVAVFAVASLLYEVVGLGDGLAGVVLATAYLSVLWINASFFLRAPYALQRAGLTVTEDGRKRILDVAVVFGTWPAALVAAVTVAALAFYFRGQEPVRLWPFIIERYAAVAAVIAAAYLLVYVLLVTRYRPAAARRYHFGGAPAEDLILVWRPVKWGLAAALPAALVVAYFCQGYRVSTWATAFAWLPPFYLALVARRPLLPEDATEKGFNATAFFIACFFSAVILPVVFAYAAQYFG